MHSVFELNGPHTCPRHSAESIYRTAKSILRLGATPHAPPLGLLLVVPSRTPRTAVCRGTEYDDRPRAAHADLAASRKRRSASLKLRTFQIAVKYCVHRSAISSKQQAPLLE